jgi:hypothetical protein
MDLCVGKQWLATVRAHQAQSLEDVSLRFLATQARDYLASVIWLPTLWTSEIVVQVAKHTFTPEREMELGGKCLVTREGIISKVVNDLFQRLA